MASKTELWLELCDRDLKGAHGMLETKNYVLTGFQCHQVAEKALKACIASALPPDEIPPKIHTLSKLLRLADLESAVSAEQLKLLDYLDPLCIEARYAGYKSALLSRLTPEYCRNLVSQTEEFLSWIKNRLSK